MFYLIVLYVVVGTLIGILPVLARFFYFPERVLIFKFRNVTYFCKFTNNFVVKLFSIEKLVHI